MPKKKSVSLKTELSRTLAQLRDNSRHDYDGVLGSLPNWIPEPFRGEFEMARNFLIAEGYKPKMIRVFIAEDARTWRSLTRHPDQCLVRPRFVLTPNVMKAVRTLLRARIASKKDPIKGIDYLTDSAHASRIAHADKYSQHQSAIAKHPRGNALDEFIDALVRDEEATAEDLWNRLYGNLDEECREPQTQWNETDPPKSTLSYETDSGKRKSITFGRFRNRVSEHRKAKRNSR
jgi:hypothetical protein